ncbi:Ca2+-binding RTX toxin-like protein [Rubricella aquisinus]|uniref:Ca2+-binding RTX toxin-like protein n=1 Tax=Rubricella aquisinus TaxID=2028108 RepID=A0A840WJL4_9RHOB|nr:Hint domain-containing protein [Rubricella aquisinus]MBB5514711.1 Ca2+-binding RTX toxin-like protein [Rubricella aquisinus]
MAVFHGFSGYALTDFGVSSRLSNGDAFSVPVSTRDIVANENDGNSNFDGGNETFEINNTAVTGRLRARIVVENDATGDQYIVYELRLTADYAGQREVYLFDSSTGAPPSGSYTVISRVQNPPAVEFQDGGGNPNFISDDEFINSNDGVTGADDTIYGYGGDDTIQGEGGNDTIFGGEGNDTLRGEGGNDTLHGDAGDDDIRGQAGNDTIFGGDGNDEIRGNGGNDIIEGGTGNDNIQGNGGADTIDGGTGNDTIVGGGGNDIIDGGADDDTIDGGNNNDTIDGGSGNDTITGGAGNDTLTGGTGNDVFIAGTVAGELPTGDTITDFNNSSGDIRDGDTTNNDFIDLSAFYTSLRDLRADQDDGVLDSAGGLILSGVARTDLTNDNTNVICFAAGTRVSTPTGPRLVEELRVGDLLNTLDNGLQPIRWIGRRELSAIRLKLFPHLRPILIRKDAFGLGNPERDLRVSPQHKIHVAAPEAQLLFSTGEVLVPACHLVDGVRVLHDPAPEDVTYIHFLCDRHEIIRAEGCLSESFHPGHIGLSTLDDAALEEVAALFPMLLEGEEPFPSARFTLRRTEARMLASARDVTVRPVVHRQKKVQHDRARKRIRY